MKNSDVIIVGAGIIGLATAYYLSKQGVSVTVIDSKDIASGASSRNGGGIRQSARDIRELPLAIHAVRNLWPNLSAELEADIEYVQKGNLRLGKTDAHKETLQKLVAQAKAVGLELHLLSRSEILEICPAISEDVQFASYCPTDGHGNPLVTSLAYYKKALAQGVQFITHDAVTNVTLQQGEIAGVTTSTASYTADKVIIAAGLTSRPLLNQLGIDVPMQAIVTETLVTDQQPLLFPQMIGTAASDFYGHQTAHGSFVFGGMDGSELYTTERKGWPNKHLTVPHICRAVLGYFPELKNANIVRSWGGVLDDCQDHVPVISAIDIIPGLYTACGFSGHGYGIAPAVGQQLAQLVVKGESELSLAAFSYKRFI